MYQTYLCPRCRSQVKHGERFCGNCGFALNWQAQAPAPPPYNYQNPQQHEWNQTPAPGSQTGWQQPPMYQQAGGYQYPYQQQYPYTGYYASKPKKSSSLLIIVLVILIIILFTVGGIGLATKGTFSFSSVNHSAQYASAPSDTLSAQDEAPADTTSPPQNSITEPPPTTTPEITTPDLHEISAAKIIEDYTVDDYYAGTVYYGKTYIITGIIISYSSATLPMYIVIAGSNTDTLGIECQFEYGSESIIESLAVGQSVKIQGKINSYKLDEGSIVVILSKVIA